jgi:hypothetical protein
LRIKLASKGRVRSAYTIELGSTFAVRALPKVGDRSLDGMEVSRARRFALPSERYRSAVLLRFIDPRTPGVSGMTNVAEPRPFSAGVDIATVCLGMLDTAGSERVWLMNGDSNPDANSVSFCSLRELILCNGCSSIDGDCIPMDRHVSHKRPLGNPAQVMRVPSK